MTAPFARCYHGCDSRNETLKEISMAQHHGVFGWYELMTSDTDAAGKFYSEVVGWTTQEVGAPAMPYTTFNVGDRGIAGMITLPPEAGPKPAWIGYIAVDDVDAHARIVADSGGAIHKGPIDVPGMLRFCVVTDPENAPYVLFTPSPLMDSTPERPAPGTPGTIGWHELMANNGDQAFDFYSKLYGWTKGEAHDMGPMGTYQVFESDGVPVGGMMTRPANVPGPFWTYYFQVESTNAAIERLKSAGGMVLQGPQQVPGGSWIVQAIDPQGAAFALMSSKE